MKLNVYKESHKLSELDLATQVQGSPGPLQFLLGRDPQCPIFLDDPRVSREHAVLVYEQQGWKLISKASIAPTYLNGNKIKEAAIHQGDQIQIGPFSLTVSLPVETAPDYQIKKTERPLEEQITSEPTLAASSAPSRPEDEGKDISGEDAAFPEADAQDASSTEAGSAASTSSFKIEGEENSGEGTTASPTEEFKMEDAAAGGDGESSNNSDNLFGEENFSNENNDIAGDGGMGGDLMDAQQTIISPTFVDCYLEINGRYAPYDHFQISSAEVFIGRDPQHCQIVLGEDAVSGKHAVVRKSNVSLMIEDLNSANGTILNGHRINQAPLADGDEFEVGSTKFKVHIESKFLDQEAGRLMPVEAQQVKEVEEVVELPSDFNEEGTAPADVEGEEFDFKAALKKNPVQAITTFIKNLPLGRKILYGVVLLFVIFALLPSGGKQVSDQASAEAPTDETSAAAAEAAEQKRFTEEELALLGPTYLLAKELFDQGKYREAMLELEKILPILGKERDYKQSKQLYDLAKQGLERLEELERKRQAEEEKKLRQEKEAALLQKAQDAVKERNATLAHALFDQIIQLNPENFDVPILKAEIEAWEKEQERIALEKAEKEAERKRQVDALAPGKALYLQKEWYKAINSLQDFLKGKNLDEDLIKEASDMLATSKAELDEIVRPMLEKALALVDGQDLKGAYELFGDILRYDPGQTVAVSKRAEIREKLDLRSRDVYRDALISESLNLFDDAKQKFQEVQQISPSDSSYYMKASRKLEHYAE